MQTEIERWLAESEALVAHQDYALALIPLNHALRRAPIGAKSSKARRLKSQALVALGHLEQALADADSAVKDDPCSIPALLQRASVLDALSRYPAAVTDYERAAQLAPDDVDSWLRLGNALLRAEKDAEAFQMFERALMTKVNSGAAWYGKGIVLERARRWNDALAAYERAIEITPREAANRAMYLNGAALLLNRMRRIPEALAMTDLANQLNSAPTAERAKAWGIGGDILYEGRHFTEALDHYEKSLALQAGNPNIWNRKGWILDHFGHLDEALAAYEEALRLDPNHPQAQRNCLYTRARLTLTETPRSETNSSTFAEISDRKIWIDTARWFASVGRYAEAEAAVDQLLRIDPYHRINYAIKAAIQFRMKQFRAVGVSLRHAWQLPKRTELK